MKPPLDAGMIVFDLEPETEIGGVPVKSPSGKSLKATLRPTNRTKNQPLIGTMPLNFSDPVTDTHEAESQNSPSTLCQQQPWIIWPTGHETEISISRDERVNNSSPVRIARADEAHSYI